MGCACPSASSPSAGSSLLCKAKASVRNSQKAISSVIRCFVSPFATLKCTHTHIECSVAIHLFVPLLWIYWQATSISLTIFILCQHRPVYSRAKLCTRALAGWLDIVCSVLYMQCFFEESIHRESIQ